MTTPAKILIVDDEPSIVALLQMNARKHGYQAFAAGSGEEALALARSILPDVVLLDIMLPGIDGVETCRRIRQEPRLYQTPIILLTAKSEEQDKITGLMEGADDYVTKPFSVAEIFARVGAVLRRNQQFAPPGGEALRIRDLTVDPVHFRVRRGQQELPLTRAEFLIFQALAQHPGAVVPRTQLIEAISGSPEQAARSLDVHIRRLRQKLNPHDNRAYIQTMRGVGYRLV